MRAETDVAIKKAHDDVGLNTLSHNRTLTPIDKQNVIYVVDEGKDRVQVFAVVPEPSSFVFMTIATAVAETQAFSASNSQLARSPIGNHAPFPEPSPGKVSGFFFSSHTIVGVRFNDPLLNQHFPQRPTLRSLPAIPSWYAVQLKRLFITRAGPAHRPIEHYLPEFERTYGAALRTALRPRATDHRRRGPPFSPLWRPALWIRPCPRPRLPSRNVRRLFLPAALPLLKLPSKTNNLGCPNHRPHHLRTGNWSSPFPNGRGFTAGTIAAFWAGVDSHPRIV